MNTNLLTTFCRAIQDLEVEQAVYNLDRQAIVSGRVTYTAGSYHLNKRASEWLLSVRAKSSLQGALHMINVNKMSVERPALIWYVANVLSA